MKMIATRKFNAIRHETIRLRNLLEIKEEELKYYKKICNNAKKMMGVKE
jgi:hypothetical protein